MVSRGNHGLPNAVVSPDTRSEQVAYASNEGSRRCACDVARDVELPPKLSRSFREAPALTPTAQTVPASTPARPGDVLIMTTVSTWDERTFSRHQKMLLVLTAKYREIR